MSPTDYSRLKRGQRNALAARLKDLVNVDEEKMRRATAQLAASLVRAAHSDPNDDYRFTVEQCLVFGYEKKFEKWTGYAGAREALNDVALEANSVAHAVISARTLSFMKNTKLEDKPKWFFHDLRILLQNLMVNPQCSDADADLLLVELNRVNSLSHEWAKQPELALSRRVFLGRAICSAP